MEQIADKTLPRGTGFEWTAMSYQEKQVGNQLYLRVRSRHAAGLSVSAGQYESWILPLAVILAVPLSLLGPVIALTAWASPIISTPRSVSSC